VKITVAGFNCEVTADEPPDAIQTFEGEEEIVEPQFIEFSTKFKWTTVLAVEGVE
jgi:hypothetical protein